MLEAVAELISHIGEVRQTFWGLSQWQCISVNFYQEDGIMSCRDCHRVLAVLYHIGRY
jgi:hypothetical protein